MNSTVSASVIVVMAQVAVTTTDPWSATLLNYGLAGVMILWFMWRDKRDSEAQERKHSENIASQKRFEDAIRTLTTSMIVGISSMKQLDAAYSELLSRIESDNHT